MGIAFKTINNHCIPYFVNSSLCNVNSICRLLATLCKELPMDEKLTKSAYGFNVLNHDILNILQVLK